MEKSVIRFKAPPGWTCLENDSWVRDPADTTWRTCWGAFTVAAHVEGLELLPDSDFYIKHSNPGDHVAEVFYGTPAMNQKLGEFALQYRRWYYD